MRRQTFRSAGRVLIAYGGVLAIAIAAAVLVLRNLNASPGVRQSKADSAPVIDSLHGVYVYDNGPVSHVAGRHIGPNGYNYGLQWQCVEFVKRYYALHLHHYMPDTWGNAKDFFDRRLPDASYNESRALVQYANPSLKKPAVDDILVFDGTLSNRYGHIAIISAVFEDHIEIIQQNAGPHASTRERIALEYRDGRWQVQHRRALGWLRVE